MSTTVENTKAAGRKAIMAAMKKSQGKDLGDKAKVEDEIAAVAAEQHAMLAAAEKAEAAKNAKQQ